MSNADSGIVTRELSKAYGSSHIYALDKLSFEIKRGEIYGYLGANGAGKSTTIRLLMNFLQPTSGSATICGLDSVKDSVRVKRHVGYLAGDVTLFPKTTGQELLDYLLVLQGVTKRTYRDDLVKRFEADLHKPISDLSKGNRQKIGIIQALMHEPDVLILDEPTSGLDPLMQEVFYDCLREAKTRGAAILMSSHNLDEAQRVCDRVGIIKHGKLIREQVIGSDTTLAAPTFKVTFASPKALAALKKNAAIKILRHVDGMTVEVQPAEAISPALAALATYDIVSMQSIQASLEDEFIGFYGDGDV